jgi:anti-anti-sigma factor
VTTLRLRGEVDMTTLAELEWALERALETGLDLVVDVGELTFIDAAGLRALARADDRLRRDGRRLRLERPNRHLRHLLGVLNLELDLDPR